MRSLLVRFVPAGLFLALVAACPDTSGQLCQQGWIRNGNYTLTLHLKPSANQCAVYDGGAVVLLPDGGSQFANVAQIAASLCTEIRSDGGPPLVHLAVLNSADRYSELGPNGQVDFNATSAPNVSNTACGCNVDYTETISGILVPSGDGGVAIDPDAGLSPIAAIDGSVVDLVDASVGAIGCLCHLPCDLQYQMDGVHQ